MRKLLALTMIVVMCLTVSTAMAQDKPKKCEVPNMTTGGYEVPGMGFGMVMYHHPEKETQTITVLEEKSVPCVDKEGKDTDCKMYRFDGEYDNIHIFCGGHGYGHPLSEFPMPPVAKKNMLVAVEDVTCK